MTVYNIPYNPQTDPKALFAQGLKNYLGGLNQQLESRRFGKALTESDSPALQELGRLVSGGRMQPQQAMGMLGALTREPLSPSQQINQLEHDFLMGLPPEERNKIIREKMTKPLVQFGKDWEAGILGPDAMADRVKKEQEKAMTDVPLSTYELEGYDEQMQTRLDNAKRHWLMQPGRINYPEKELFRQWKIFAGMYKFKNDTQRGQIWNVWKENMRIRAAEGWFGKETDFDPTDPKWREAIGLKAPTETDELSENELDALIEEFNGDEKAIRKAAKERGLTIPK